MTTILLGLLMAALLSFAIYTLVILQLQIKHMRTDVLALKQLIAEQDSATNPTSHPSLSTPLFDAAAIDRIAHNSSAAFSYCISRGQSSLKLLIETSVALAIFLTLLFASESILVRTTQALF